MQQNFRKNIALISICYLFLHEMTWNLKCGHVEFLGTDVVRDTRWLQHPLSAVGSWVGEEPQGAVLRKLHRYLEPSTPSELSWDNMWESFDSRVQKPACNSCLHSHPVNNLTPWLSSKPITLTKLFGACRWQQKGTRCCFIVIKMCKPLHHTRLFIHMNHQDAQLPPLL